MRTIAAPLVVAALLGFSGGVALPQGGPRPVAVAAMPACLGADGAGGGRLALHDAGDEEAWCAPR